MKIVFVHLGRENLGIEYLSAVLKNHGYKVSLVLDPGLFGFNDNVFYIPFLEKFFSMKKIVIYNILSQDADLIAFSCYTNTYKWCCDVAKEVKRMLPFKKVVFGGIHATLIPEKIIKNEFVDYVIVGEAEFAMLELVQHLEQGISDVNIKNVWYKKDGNVIKNEVREPIKDLNNLPFPDKEIFEDWIRYRDDYVILTARGCVFNCTYCCESYLNYLYNSKYFRRRSVDSVMQELRMMKTKYNFKEVMFFDSIFFTDKKWLKKLMHIFKKEINVPFRCTGHVNFFDEEVAKIMKEGGCYCIDFGIQTLNESTKKNILNRNETNERIKKAFNICDKYKLRYDVDFMFGFPKEGENDYRLIPNFFDDFKYLNRLKCYNLSYYPKCKIVNFAKEEGILNEKDLDKINNGEIGDWFHINKFRDSNFENTKDDFQHFFKSLPLIPLFLRHFIVRHNIYKYFHFIPFGIIVLLQIIIAIKHKDYRFILYPKNYIHQIRKVLSFKFLFAIRKIN